MPRDSGGPDGGTDVKQSRPIVLALVLAALLGPPVVNGSAAPQKPVVEEVRDDFGATADLQNRVFTIRYRGIDEVYLMISPLLGPRGAIRTQPHKRTVAVSDTPETLRRIAEVIVAFDIPPRSVEVSVQLIMASVDPGSEAPPPPPIRGVVERLNALNTRWKDYRLVGDARVMGMEGESSAVQVGDRYRVAFRVDRVSDENRLIRFKPFELQRREPAVEGMERYTSIMSTVLNLRDSQLFIVGASKMERSNRALFMTVTAALQPVRP